MKCLLGSWASPLSLPTCHSGDPLCCSHADCLIPRWLDTVICLLIFKHFITCAWSTWKFCFLLMRWNTHTEKGLSIMYYFMSNYNANTRAPSATSRGKTTASRDWRHATTTPSGGASQGLPYGLHVPSLLAHVGPSSDLTVIISLFFSIVLPIAHEFLSTVV